jgi:hypothetical protein
VQVFDIITIVAIVLAVAAGAGLALVYRRLLRYQRNQRVIMGSRGTVDIVEHVTAVDEKLTNVRLALEDLTLLARDHDVRIDSSLAGVGIVRFDAYHDLGGRQSTAVAFLNHLGDGVVITTVVSRDFARMYVKLLKGGDSDIPLAPEEIEAVEQARGSSPFTIRPRTDAATTGRAEGAGDADSLSTDTPMSGGLPGLRGDAKRELDRENRRRQRRGLPTLEDEVVPSARGWDAPETMSAGSLAERFIQERRQSQDRADLTEDGELFGARDEGGGSREL